MLRDITLGQYYPKESLIHRLDPRVKLMGTIVYLVSLFLGSGPICYLYAIGCLAAVIRLSGVPVSYMVRGLKGLLVIMLISVSFNLFMTEGTTLIQLWFLTITWEGLWRAIEMAIRLILLVMGSTVMTLTTTPNALTDGMEKGLGFLKRIHVPVHEIAMIMSIALRFIPILIEETDKIMKAQMARGADFESGSIIRRLKAMVPLLIPLFLSAFRRASDLAMAMEARCYRGGDSRTRMKPLHYQSLDRKAYLVLFLYLAGMLLIGALWQLR